MMKLVKTGAKTINVVYTMFIFAHKTITNLLIICGFFPLREPQENLVCKRETFRNLVCRQNTSREPALKD